MRICIVGAGEIAKVHIKGINKIAGAEVVGILDRYFTRGEMLSEMIDEGHGNAVAYVDYETMLQEQNPDVVHICLPPNLHFSYAEQALNHGAHILVEKPFTVTLQEAERLYEIAEQKHLKICPMYNHLFDKAALEVKALVKSRAIGEVVNVESYYGFNLGGAKSKYNLKGSAHWVYDTPGGHLLNIGPHILSTMLEFIGAEHVEFTPMAINRGKAREGMFDEYRVLVKNGKNTGYFTLSLNANPYFHYLNIYGTKSSLFYDIANWHYKRQALNPRLPNALARALNNFSVSWKGISSTIGATLQSLTGRLTHFDGMWELMAQFYQAIEQDLPAPISKEVNLATVRGLETIEKVTSQGRL